jgi:hypothetical protein
MKLGTPFIGKKMECTEIMVLPVSPSCILGFVLGQRDPDAIRNRAPVGRLALCLLIMIRGQRVACWRRGVRSSVHTLLSSQCGRCPCPCKDRGGVLWDLYIKKEVIFIYGNRLYFQRMLIMK